MEGKSTDTNKDKGTDTETNKNTHNKKHKHEDDRLEFTLRKLCAILCCPPFPSKIAEKIALPGPTSSYKIIPDESGQKFSIEMGKSFVWPYRVDVNEILEVFYTMTNRGNRIACMFCQCSRNNQFTILFSNMNCADMGDMCKFYFEFGTRINCNIFTYDYSGYGESSGKPSEKNLYADSEAAYECLMTRFGIPPKNIILYGQSIGTSATVHLASKHEVGGVILHSPLMSAMTVTSPGPRPRKPWCCDIFPNINKAENIRSPVLLIHGSKDDMVDLSHGHAFYNKCPRLVEPLWVEGARHNDIHHFEDYFDRVKYFVSVELMH